MLDRNSHEPEAGWLGSRPRDLGLRAAHRGLADETPATQKTAPRRLWPFVLVVAVVLSGCASPEDGRPRGGGHGADGGNYRPGAVHVPSKLDGTRIWTDRPKA
jgi:hypothetical protein